MSISQIQTTQKSGTFTSMMPKWKILHGETVSHTQNYEKYNTAFRLGLKCIKNRNEFCVLTRVQPCELSLAYANIPVSRNLGNLKHFWSQAFQIRDTQPECFEGWWRDGLAFCVPVESPLIFSLSYKLFWVFVCLFVLVIFGLHWGCTQGLLLSHTSSAFCFSLFFR
jgi:hypothetical protein